jgi:hypothetical protein
MAEVRLAFFLFCSPSDHLSYMYGVFCPILADALSADRENAVSRSMARNRAAAAQSGSSGAAASEDVSLYRSELVAVHFNCKNRPAPNGKRGTEICLPHTFSVDTSGTMSVLGKPTQAPASPGK